jgi:hypothetical protein
VSSSSRCLLRLSAKTNGRLLLRLLSPHARETETRENLARLAERLKKDESQPRRGYRCGHRLADTSEIASGETKIYRRNGAPRLGTRGLFIRYLGAPRAGGRGIRKFLHRRGWVESKGRGSRPRPKSLLFFYVGVLTTSPPSRSVINSRTAYCTDLISPRRERARWRRKRRPRCRGGEGRGEETQFSKAI